VCRKRPLSLTFRDGFCRLRAVEHAEEEGEVFRVVHIPSQPERVAIHAVPVAIEDRGETAAIAPERSSPGRVLLRKRCH